jgi:hypothetical protein
MEKNNRGILKIGANEILAIPKSVQWLDRI